MKKFEITKPFEDSLKLAKFKFISLKTQKIVAKDIENFEFEFEPADINQICSETYPENKDLIRINFETINNRNIFSCSFDENKKYIIIFKICIFNISLGKIVYFIDLSEYFKNTPIVRKNILETLDRLKLQKLVLSCKKELK